MARKPSSSSLGNESILGKAKHLVRRFSWDMDDQPPPSNSGDDPEDDSLTASCTAMAGTTTTVTATAPAPATTTVPIASLKRSTTAPMSTTDPATQRPPGWNGKAEDAEYWKDLYARRDKSTEPDILTLDVEYDELAEAWKRYQDSLPAGVSVEYPNPRTADDVIDVVRAANQEWSSSKYSAHWDLSRTLLNRFCLSLPAHSAVLNAFGYGEEYVHLFYDVLQSLIKVSVDYRKITEDLIRSLLEVGEAIDCCIRDMDSHPPEQAMGVVAKLYTIIFFFLQEVLDWYTRKVTCRQLGSLNEDLYGDFRGLVAGIKQMWMPSNGRPTAAGSLGSDGSTGSGHNNTLLELEETRMSQVGMKGYYRTLTSQSTLTRQLIHEMQADARQRDYLSTERADLLNELLSALKPKLHGLMGPKCQFPEPDIVTPSDSSSSKWSRESSCSEPGPLNTDDADSSDSSDSSDSADPATSGTPAPKQRGSKHKITKMELQFSSRDLQDFFHNDEQLARFELKDEVFADGLELAPLGEWTSSSRSQLACFTSYCSQTVTPPPSTLISAYYTSVARKMNIPVISHFCSETPRSNGSTTLQVTLEAASQVSDGLLSLGCSLLRQLIDIAPPVLDFDVSRDISATRFTGLMVNHGTLKTWREIVSLVDTLLTFAPPLTVIVIDRVEHLLDSGDAGQQRSLEALVDVFRKHVTRTNESLVSSTSSMLSHPSVCKVLFTSSEESKALDEVFLREELITAENLHVEGPS